MLVYYNVDSNEFKRESQFSSTPAEVNFIFHAPSDYSDIASVTYGYRWFGTVYVDDDFTIPAGKRVTVNPGTAIKVSPGKKIIVNGTFELLGTSSEPITFDKNGSSNWYGIVINSASGSSSRIEYATIKNASYGIYINGASPEIYDTKINNCTYNVYISGGSPDLARNTITYAGMHGVYCTNASPSFSPGTAYGDNVIRENEEIGIYAINNSSVFLGIVDLGGRNSIYG
ncbi:MAG: hypothetical protein D6814_17205, partial [Calditrichaeota bacterium]